MDHGGLKGPKHQLLSQGGIGVLVSTMSIECNLTESRTFYRKGGWWGSCQKHGEYGTVEENGPKAKNTAGHWVFLFHRVLLMYISHTQQIYICKRGYHFRSPSKRRGLGESKGLVDTVLS